MMDVDQVTVQCSEQGKDNVYFRSIDYAFVNLSGRSYRIKGVLCSFIWADLCQISPGDGICTSHNIRLR